VTVSLPTVVAQTPQQVPASLEALALRAGQVVEARVLTAGQGGSAQLAIGNQVVDAALQVCLQTGRLVRLLVQGSGQNTSLTVLPPEGGLEQPQTPVRAAPAPQQTSAPQRASTPQQPVSEAPPQTQTQSATPPVPGRPPVTHTPARATTTVAAAPGGQPPRGSGSPAPTRSSVSTTPSRTGPAREQASQGNQLVPLPTVRPAVSVPGVTPSALSIAPAQVQASAHGAAQSSPGVSQSTQLAPRPCRAFACRGQVRRRALSSCKAACSLRRPAREMLYGCRSFSRFNPQRRFSKRLPRRCRHRSSGRTAFPHCSRASRDLEGSSRNCPSRSRRRAANC
jgi:hypothetical protein